MKKNKIIKSDKIKKIEFINNANNDETVVVSIPSDNIFTMVFEINKKFILYHEDTSRYEFNICKSCNIVLNEKDLKEQFKNLFDTVVVVYESGKIEEYDVPYKESKNSFVENYNKYMHIYDNDYRLIINISKYNKTLTKIKNLITNLKHK